MTLNDKSISIPDTNRDDRAKMPPILTSQEWQAAWKESS